MAEEDPSTQAPAQANAAPADDAMDGLPRALDGIPNESDQDEIDEMQPIAMDTFSSGIWNDRSGARSGDDPAPPAILTRAGSEGAESRPNLNVQVEDVLPGDEDEIEESVDAMNILQPVQGFIDRAPTDGLLVNGNEDTNDIMINDVLRASEILPVHEVLVNDNVSNAAVLNGLPDDQQNAPGPHPWSPVPADTTPLGQGTATNDNNDDPERENDAESNDDPGSDASSTQAVDGRRPRRTIQRARVRFHPHQPGRPSTEEVIARIARTASASVARRQRQDLLRLRIGNGRLRTNIVDSVIGSAPATLSARNLSTPNGIANANLGASPGASTTQIRVHLEHLRPQQLPDSPEVASAHQQIDERDDNNDLGLDRFKCGICCEFMSAPAGCGKCAARFCVSCLERVITTASGSTARRPQAEVTGTARCPICRQHFTRQDIAVDEQLQTEIDESYTVPCRYPGCTEQLTLSAVAAHEAVCDHVLVRCRYTPYGCQWKGKRGDLENHESQLCSLARISGLVQAVRLADAQAQAALRMATSSTQQIVVQNQQTTGVLSMYNPIQLFQYIWMMLCATPFFFKHSGRWHSFFASPECIAAVHNLFLFLPTLVMGCMVSLSGFKQFLTFLETNYETEEELFIALENVLLAFCVGALTALMLAANFADTASSIRWREFDIKFVGNVPILRDCIAIATFAICVGSTEVFDSTPRARLAMFCNYCATAYFPFLVTSIAQQASGHSVVDLTESYAWSRASNPVLFGVRYGMIASVFGYVPAVGALLTSVLPRRAFPSTRYVGLYECNFCGLSAPTLAGLTLSAMLYLPLEHMLLTQKDAGSSLRQLSLSYVMAMVLKILINFLSFNFAQNARTAGLSMAQEAIRLAAQAQGQRMIHYNMPGMVAFAILASLFTGMILAVGP